ncbi:hypothetical protein [Streptomyces acidiscabies]|uniref:hypothetical protein n=1 Tax=Streptomyces acidiscabies TaxID=42234 RepID=UPI0009526760|nr:hypothetical protein [Streptomyces acidiscabies]
MTPAEELRAAADQLRGARFTGAITATPIVAALIRAREPLADWLTVSAVIVSGYTDPEAAEEAGHYPLAVARQILGTTP